MLRKSPRTGIYLTGTTNDKLPVSKLPTKKECLCLFFHNTRNLKMSVSATANSVINDVLTIRNKARVPSQDKSHCVSKIKELDKS